MPRLRAALLLLLVCLPGAGCATTVGFAAGPVTGPVTYWRHTQGTPTWLKAVLLPLTIPVGPVVGMVQGIRADAGALANGGYGRYPAPPFEIVWDPANTALGRPTMDESYGKDARHEEYVRWGSLADRREGAAGSK